MSLLKEGDVGASHVRQWVVSTADAPVIQAIKKAQQYRNDELQRKLRASTASQKNPAVKSTSSSLKRPSSSLPRGKLSKTPKSS